MSPTGHPDRERRSRPLTTEYRRVAATALGSFPLSVDLDREDQSSRLEGECHRATPVDYPVFSANWGATSKGGALMVGRDSAESTAGAEASRMLLGRTPYVGAILVASATELAPPIQPLSESPFGVWF